MIPECEGEGEKKKKKVRMSFPLYIQNSTKAVRTVPPKKKNIYPIRTEMRTAHFGGGREKKKMGLF